LKNNQSNNDKSESIAITNQNNRNKIGSNMKQKRGNKIDTKERPEEQAAKLIR
jgi:hypothetical protein